MLDILERLFSDNYDANNLYRWVGVVFWDFKKINPFQLSIFDKSLRSDEKKLALFKSLEKINSKYDKKIVNFWEKNMLDDGLRLFIRK